MSEDEMQLEENEMFIISIHKHIKVSNDNLVIISTLVWSKHNSIWSFIIELILEL